MRYFYFIFQLNCLAVIHSYEIRLFIIYANDFSEASNMFEFIMYADDTTLSSTLRTFSSNTFNKSTQTLINEEIFGRGL